jgi:hypothetical protein
VGELVDQHDQVGADLHDLRSVGEQVRLGQIAVAIVVGAAVEGVDLVGGVGARKAR